MNSPFVKISEDTWQTLQYDAGVLLSEYDITDPLAEPDSEDIIATTTGGFNLKHTVNYKDLAEDIDNVPNGMKEFMAVDNYEITLDFTSIKFNKDNLEWSLGAADTVEMSGGVQKIVPRNNLKQSDFKTIWLVLPLMQGGALAVKLGNVLSSSGLNIQTSKNEKGTNSITLSVHPSVYAQNTVPVEYYLIPAPELDELTVTSSAGTTAGKSVIGISGYTLGTNESFKYKLGTAVEDIEYGDIIGVDYSEIDDEDEIAATTGQKITVVAVDADGYALAAGNATITAAAAGA